MCCLAPVQQGPRFREGCARRSTLCALQGGTGASVKLEDGKVTACGSTTVMSKINAAHGDTCSCEPLFENGNVIGKNLNTLAWGIIGAGLSAEHVQVRAGCRPAACAVAQHMAQRLLPSAKLCLTELTTAAFLLSAVATGRPTRPLPVLVFRQCLVES